MDRRTVMYWNMQDLIVRTAAIAFLAGYAIALGLVAALMMLGIVCVSV